MTTADSGPSQQGTDVRMKEAGGSGWIPVQGEGRGGTYDAATSTRIRFERMISNDLFSSAKVAADGCTVENTGSGLLVARRSFGPDVQ